MPHALLYLANVPVVLSHATTFIKCPCISGMTVGMADRALDWLCASLPAAQTNMASRFVAALDKLLTKFSSVIRISCSRDFNSVARIGTDQLALNTFASDAELITSPISLYGTKSILYAILYDVTFASGAIGPDDIIFVTNRPCHESMPASKTAMFVPAPVYPRAIEYDRRMSS